MDVKQLAQTSLSRGRRLLERTVNAAADRLKPSSEDDSISAVVDLPVSRLTSRRMVTVALQTSLTDCIAALVDNDVGLVIVSDGEGVEGVVSERDIIDALYEGADLDVVWAGDVMQSDVVRVASDTPVVSAGRIMAEEGIRHLVIEGADGGVLSIRDVVGALVA